MAASTVAVSSAQAASVYVTNSSSNQVSQYTIAANGKLSPMSPARVATGMEPWGIAVSPNGRDVYVTNRGDNSVSQYTASSTGRLLRKTPAEVPTGHGPMGIAISPDGRSVYATNSDGGTVSQYNVGAGGRLSPKKPGRVAAGDGPTEVAVSPDGKSLYVLDREVICECTGEYGILQYDIGTQGKLSPKFPSGVTTGQVPRGLALSPDGRSAYLAATFCGGSTCADTADQYRIGTGGRLTPVDTEIDTGRKYCSGSQSVVSPNGASVYITQACLRVRQYSRAPNGHLTAKDPAGVPTAAKVQGIAITADGRNVYVANTPRGDSISQYSVNSLGQLAPKTPRTVSAGNDPIRVATNPSAIP
jgi:DNA-binding beta-propeller fold protein YncE